MIGHRNGSAKSVSLRINLDYLTGSAPPGDSELFNSWTSPSTATRVNLGQTIPPIEESYTMPVRSPLILNLGAVRADEYIWTVITDNTSAVVGQNYELAFTTSKTLTLPSSPVVNDFIRIRYTGTAPAIIACNGNKIDGYATDKQIKATFAKASIKLVYTGSINGWIPYIFESIQISANSQYLRASFWDKFVHYYDFKRRRSDFYSVNAKDLLTGNSSYISDTINGKSQDGVFLSGSTIRCPSDTTFQVGQHSLICAFQHNHFGSVLYPGVVTKRQGDNSNFEYSIIFVDDGPSEVNGTLNYQVSNTGNFATGYAQTPVTSAIPVSTPVFVHAYYNGSVIGIRRDGDSPLTSAWTNGVFAGTSDFEVGGRGHDSASRLSSSRFYFVGLTNSVLTNLEVDEIYNGGAWNKMP